MDIGLLNFISGAFRSTIKSASLTANRTILSPNKDGTLLVDADWASPGAFGIATPNVVRATTVTIGSTTKETRSATQPTSPSAGDLWLEVDGSNYPLYGWFWRWNGTYWLSPDLLMECSFSGVATASGASFYCNPGFNYYFKSLNISALTTVAQSAGNLWTIVLDRRNAANIPTTISSPTTSGNAANAQVRSATSILTQVNTSSTGAISFSVSVNPTGTAGSLYVGIQVVFNYARL